MALVVFLFVAYRLPDEIPIWVQRFLSLMNAVLALVVFVLATHRRHHEVDPTALRRQHRERHLDGSPQRPESAKHRHQRMVKLPLVGETSVRAISGTMIFFGVILWWLTPWAPVVVQGHESENLSAPLGNEILSVVLMLADPQLAVPHPPVRPTAAAVMASTISVDSGVYLLGQKATAEGRYDDARAMLSSSQAAQSAKPAEVFLALAQNEVFAGRYAEGAEQYDRLLQTHPSDPLLWAQAAVAWLHAGNYERAEQVVADAVSMSGVHKETENAATLTAQTICLHVQAAVYMCRGKQFEKAEQYNKKVQDILRETAPDSSAFAASLNNQAVLFQLLGKYPGAQNNHNFAYSTWMKSLGARHPYMAASRSNLAMLLYMQGNYPEARQMAEQATQLRREILSPSHPVRALGQNVTAFLDLAAGNYRTGLTEARQALQRMEETLPPQAPQLAAACRCVGGYYQAMARYRRAEYFYSRMAEISQRGMSGSHPYVACSSYLLGSLYLNEGRLSEARSRAEFALRMDETTLRSDHPAAARDLCLLAQVLMRMNQPKQARTRLERALLIQRAALPEQHPDIAFTQSLLASLENEPATYAKGEELYEEALKMDESLLGPRHPAVAEIRYNLGRLLMTEQKYADAEKEIARCLEIRKAALTPYHPQLAETYELRAELLRKMDPDAKDTIEELGKQAAKVRSEHVDMNAQDTQALSNGGA